MLPAFNGPGRFATVYNTLHQFTEAGLLRQVAIDSPRSYFDTNKRNTTTIIWKIDTS